MKTNAEIRATVARIKANRERRKPIIEALRRREEDRVLMQSDHLRRIDDEFMEMLKDCLKWHREQVEAHFGDHACNADGDNHACRAKDPGNCRICRTGKYAEGNSGVVNPEFETEVDEILAAIFSGDNTNKKAEIGEIDVKLLEAGKAHGFDLTGYNHTIDIYGVRHTFKNHGNKETEAKRGQIAITESDIKQIPEVIYNYDNVVFSGKNKTGRETITFMKKMTDGTTVYVEEIRTGNKTLTLNSMRKQNKTTKT